MVLACKKSLLAFFIILFFHGVTSHAQTIPPSLADQVTELAPLIIRFDADEGSLTRFYTIQNSPERRERLRTFYKEYLAQLEQLPFESLGTSGKADYLLFRRDLENELYLLS